MSLYLNVLVFPDLSEGSIGEARGQEDQYINTCIPGSLNPGSVVWLVVECIHIPPLDSGLGSGAAGEWWVSAENDIYVFICTRWSFSILDFHMLFIQDEAFPYSIFTYYLSRKTASGSPHEEKARRGISDLN